VRRSRFNSVPACFYIDRNCLKDNTRVRNSRDEICLWPILDQLSLFQIFSVKGGVLDRYSEFIVLGPTHFEHPQTHKKNNPRYM